jgi:DNA-directed RNA polymerase specialized sigma24 family protein
MDGAERGDPSAADALFAALYRELHRLAKCELAHKGFAVSLGPTTLLHQAYIAMVAKDGAAFPDRARFMGYAARVMRGLIIDHVRGRTAQKRGGQFEIFSAGIEIENENAVLDELGKSDPPLARVVC